MNNKMITEFFDAVEQCDTLKQLKRCGQRWHALVGESITGWTFYWKQYEDLTVAGR
jgi:hypothetical protein